MLPKRLIYFVCGLKLLYRKQFAIKYVVVDCSNIANLFRVVVVYYTFTWNFGLSVVQHVVYVIFDGEKETFEYRVNVVDMELSWL